MDDLAGHVPDMSAPENVSEMAEMAELMETNAFRGAEVQAKSIISDSNHDGLACFKGVKWPN